MKQRERERERERESRRKGKKKVKSAYKLIVCVFGGLFQIFFTDKNKGYDGTEISRNMTQGVSYSKQVFFQCFSCREN